MAIQLHHRPRRVDRRGNRLTEGEVKMIRRLNRAGFTQERVALAFKTCQSNVSYIIRRITHK